MIRFLKTEVGKTISGLFIAAAIFGASFVFFKNLATDLELLQEYHKAVVGVASIFLAFSPAFYALLYSNDNMRIAIRNMQIKQSFDARFRKSLISAFLFLGVSLLGIITSYAYESESLPIHRAMLSASFAGLFLSAYWSLYYGRMALNIIGHLMR